MKENKNIFCIEGEYFSCPDTTSSISDKQKEKEVPYEMELDEKHYKKSVVIKRSYKLYEKQ